MQDDVIIDFYNDYDSDSMSSESPPTPKMNALKISRGERETLCKMQKAIGSKARHANREIFSYHNKV